jgi:3-methyladenine DNA glycosylase AlkD
MIALLEDDLEGTVDQARTLIGAGAAWFVCDIFGVRVVGEALLRHFDRTQRILRRWIDGENPWVQRTVGVAAHHFAKRAPRHRGRNRRLILLLLRQIESRKTHVVKGVGWGLETIAKHNPGLLLDTLCPRLGGKRLTALMRKKICAKLSPDQRARMEACLEGER